MSALEPTKRELASWDKAVDEALGYVGSVYNSQLNIGKIASRVCLPGTIGPFSLARFSEAIGVSRRTLQVWITCYELVVEKDPVLSKKRVFTKEDYVKARRIIQETKIENHNEATRSIQRGKIVKTPTEGYLKTSYHFFKRIEDKKITLNAKEKKELKERLKKLLALL